MSDLARRRLGNSDLDVSVLSLGSWRTFERLPRDEALAVMAAARAAGITFLDDARYDDETGSAPLRTGWSEVLFGELFRAAGWVRDDVVVANKLWWEFWPDQSATAELDASLGRMGFDHVDLIYAMTLPEGLEVADAVAAVARLVTSGRARAWGVANWRPAEIELAVAASDDLGVARPCAAQLPYSLARPRWVEDPAMVAALGAGGLGLVASSALNGGTLSGKYLQGGSGRASDDPGDVDLARALVELGVEWGVQPAQLALAFVLDHPLLASLLFGATSPEQLASNVDAVAVHDSLDDGQLDRLRGLRAGPRRG